MLDFEGTVDILVKTYSCDTDDKRKISRSITHNTVELIGLLNNIYSQVKGKGIKSKIAQLKKALANDNDYLSSDYSIFSESDYSDNS